LLATTLALLGAVIGSIALTVAIDRGSRERFDITLDVFESVIADQVDGFRIVSFGLPALLGAEGDGLTVDFIDELVSDRAGAAALVGALPVEGFAGIGLIVYEATGEPQPLMLPSLQGLDDSDLLLPDVLAVADDARATGRNVISEPIEIGDGVRYAYAVPTTSDVVVVEILDPNVLISNAGIRNGVRAVEAVALDEATARVVGSTGAVPAGAAPYTTLEVRLFGRDLLIDAYPGEGFESPNGAIPGISGLVLGLLIAGLIYVVGVVNRRHTNEQAERLELARQINEDKDRFIAAVSHELRTPLTSVVGLADELADGLGDFELGQVHELIAIMAQESHEMSLLVEDLLVAARLEEGVVTARPEVVDLVDQVDRVILGLGTAGNSIRVEATDIVAWADPLRLRQIIRNLIANALRHGGPDVEVRIGRGGDVAFVEVVDNGAPVPASARQRMFEPYYRSAVVRGQAPSVGLGLSVSHQLTKLMGGDLSYDYLDGWGVFRLEVPRSAAADVSLGRVAVPG
jgi:signal transduction histidine kinase